MQRELAADGVDQDGLRCWISYSYRPRLKYYEATLAVSDDAIDGRQVFKASVISPEKELAFGQLIDVAEAFRKARAEQRRASPDDLD